MGRWIAGLAFLLAPACALERSGFAGADAAESDAAGSPDAARDGDRPGPDAAPVDATEPDAGDAGADAGPPPPPRPLPFVPPDIEVPPGSVLELLAGAVIDTGLGTVTGATPESIYSVRIEAAGSTICETIYLAAERVTVRGEVTVEGPRALALIGGTSVTVMPEGLIDGPARGTTAGPGGYEGGVERIGQGPAGGGLGGYNGSCCDAGGGGGGGSGRGGDGGKRSGGGLGILPPGRQGDARDAKVSGSGPRVGRLGGEPRR